jgi:hypothetical protein
VRPLAVALLLCSTPAAADHPRVHLEIDACFGDARPELERVIMIELGDRLATEPDTRGDGTYATVRCEASGAVLHVDDSLTHRSVWRRISEPAEPRLVALALVELISASYTELQPAVPPPAPTAAPPPTPPPAPIVAAPLAVSTPYRAHVTAGALKFSSGDTTLAGLGVRVSATRPVLGWMIDAQAHRGSQSMMLGELSTDVLALGAAAQLQLSQGRTRVELGAGLRGGAVHMSGMPSGASVQGSAFWSRWFGPLVLSNLAYSVSERVAIDAAAEAGYVVSPVSALVGGQPAASVDGTWLTFHVGVAVKL